jgi:hypothetical protein
MDVEHALLAAIARWNNEGLTVLHEANVTEKAFVQDSCYRCKIMLASRGITVKFGSARFEVHGKTLVLSN